jgi:hypothetical protein
LSNPELEFIPTTPEIEEFAKLLVQHVRDVAIQECDRLLTPQSLSPPSERWRRVAQNGNPEALLKEAIPDIVDSTLFWLMDAIDEGWLRLSYRAENGKVADLNAEGEHELGGWYVGEEVGWRPMYAKQRFVKDFAPDS